MLVLLWSITMGDEKDVSIKNIILSSSRRSLVAEAGSSSK